MRKTRSPESEHSGGGPQSEVSSTNDPLPDSFRSLSFKEEQLAKESEHREWLADHGNDSEMKLLKNIKERILQLESLLRETDDHEDDVYRF